MNYTKMQKTIEDFIADKVGEKEVVVGLSGGIDSSLTCVLAKNALGRNRVHGLVLAHSKFAQVIGLDKVQEFAQTEEITLSEIDISQVRNAIVGSLNQYGEIHKPTLDVRLCDMYLRLYANANECIYLGTINATEKVTGWFPKGALTGDYDVLGDVFKKQIKDLATHVGLGYLVPTVSDEAKYICEGCGELPEFEGISYDDLDNMLLLHRKNPETFEQECENTGFPKENYTRILNRITKVGHKSENFPQYPIVNGEEK